MMRLITFLFGLLAVTLALSGTTAMGGAMTTTSTVKMAPTDATLTLQLTGTSTRTGTATGREPRATLARHATVAEFEGVSYHRCMGLTALCPDQCGESGSFATFKIIKYVKYEKLGEYGDPKCEQFMFLVEDNMKHPKVPAAIRDAVNALKKGDRVLLSWDHDYVTVNGSSGPERPVTKLEKLPESTQSDSSPAGDARPAPSGPSPAGPRLER